MLKILVYVAWSVQLVSQAAILDPALYLSPSPPLTGVPRAVDDWARGEPSTETVADQGNVDPLTEEPEAPQARTFWPAQPQYGIRGIHIPLTFTLTGSYGHSGPSTGVIGSSYSVNSPMHGVVSSFTNTPIRGIIASSYASVSEDTESKYGKSGLAGSGYGTRVYGGGSGQAWSGWGNGKWGHYGKG